jgi:hypothetical protein
VSAFWLTVRVRTLSDSTNLVTSFEDGILRSWSITVAIRWDEKAGLRRDAVGSQVIDALEAQETKETGNEED